MGSTHACGYSTAAAVLALDEVVHHARPEGARAVERDGGDDVLEAVGAELLEEPCMPVDSSWKTFVVSPEQRSE
jgi:hypothetical protein